MRARREIVVLTPCADGADGISEVSRQLAAALAADREVRVSVWALDGGVPAPERMASVEFRSAHGSAARFATWAVARARPACADLVVVVMHVHLAPVALPLALRGARLACFFHGIEVWKPLRAPERAAVARASVLMANSQWTADRFRDANPTFAAAPISVCHLAVPPRPAAVHPQRTGYALAVGRLAAEERYKGHDALIACWPAVRQRARQAELVVVGDGDDRPRLQSLVRERGLEHAIHFAGRVSDEALAGYYDHAAFLALPSTGEGFGLVYLEAMRAAKPCIAAPGAAQEIVVDGATGFIVDPLRPGALVDAIARLFNDPALCAAMGRAGARRVAASFAPDHFAAAVRGCLAPAGAIIA